MAKPVRLVQAPKRMAMLEQHMRYDVLLNGEFFDALRFNMSGYIGSIPVMSEGQLIRMDIGERPLTTYRKEIAQTNREILAQKDNEA